MKLGWAVWLSGSDCYVRRNVANLRIEPFNPQACTHMLTHLAREQVACSIMRLHD